MQCCSEINLWTETKWPLSLYDLILHSIIITSIDDLALLNNIKLCIDICYAWYEVLAALWQKGKYSGMLYHVTSETVADISKDTVPSKRR